MNPELNWFFEKASPWQNEYALLRTIVLSCGLQEELKWGVPCYTLNGANIVLMHGFKDYCALLFHKGALLNDEQGILIQQTKNVQAARQVRFTSLDDIEIYRQKIISLIRQAIDVEKAGLQVEMKKTEAFDMPDELQEVLNDMPDVKRAFEALTPGRQRGYLLYFSQPRQAKTREARIAKSLEKILKGQGLND